MGYVLFSVSAYIFMRAFEVLFADKKDRQWYKTTIKIIAIGVVYTALAGMLVFYFTDLRLLGFSPE